MSTFFLKNLQPLTFEEVGSKAGLVDGAIWNKFHPQLVGAGFDVIWLVVATEASQQGAVFRVPITHFQVVIGTTVMSLNLGFDNNNNISKSVIKLNNCTNKWQSTGVLPQKTGRWGLHGSPALQLSSTHTLCSACSHQGSWGIGSGRCLSSPPLRRWLHVTIKTI